MINRTNTQSKYPGFLPKYSDQDIIRGLLNSEYWRLLFLGDPKSLWVLGKAILGLKTQMFAAPIKAILRFDFGKRTLGIISILLTVLMMIAFNTTWLVGYVATLMPLVSPVIPLYMDGDQIYMAVFVDIRSSALLYFWMVYIVLAVVHLIRIYKGWGKPHSSSSRGRSVLHVLILGRAGMSERNVQLVVEPLLIALIGAGLIWLEADVTFGIFLCLSAFCLFCQEAYQAISEFRLSG